MLDTSPVVIENMRDGYADLVRGVLLNGRPVAPRGYKTWEVEDATFELLDPTDALPVGVGRDINPAIGAAEALCLIGGIGDPTLMTSVSKAFHRFLDGGQLHGAYGPRVAPQLVQAVKRLERDPDSRQAIVTIWDPMYDNSNVRDLPCTLSFNFRIRDDKLNMSTTMRSNDVWLGTAYDVFMFTQLQCTIANVLEIPVGTYRHHAYSLHLYERNIDAVDQLHDFNPEAEVLKLEGFHPDPRQPHDSTAGDRMAQAMERAGRVHDVEPVFEPSLTEHWFETTLRGFDRLVRTDNFKS